MAVLASCWLILESILIPQGFFLKWFYLRFYIHPFFLFASQLFLYLKWLQRWILAFFMYPFRIIFFFLYYVHKFCTIYVSSIFRVSQEIHSNPEAADDISPNQLISLSICSAMDSVSFKTEFVDNIEEAKNGIVPHMEDWSFRLQKDWSLDERSSSFCESSPCMDESYLNEYSPLFSSFNSPAYTSASHVEEREPITTAIDEEDESQGFYMKYSERMRWFDVLNYDRTQGISTIPYITWTNLDEKKLSRSLQSDIELVYVAQSCLTWETLLYQYRKVKFLSFTNCSFSDDLAKDFQNFHVLLQRFMEEETYLYKGKRASNYAKARLFSKTLLQVPKITGCLEGEKVDAKDVLKAIEKCIKTFGKFISTERNTNWWKLKTSFWTYSPMEDPKDLDLLAGLTATLGKKEVWLKDLEGKRKCWFKKVVKPMEESQKEAMVFTSIEVKLISRVLQMSIVSSSQLSWCQQKLNNIQFKRGRLFRTATGPLFPS